jgi:NAD(P)-dependent dehydrogenase (short-subunit alcohol dehydrogenase family)
MVNSQLAQLLINRRIIVTGGTSGIGRAVVESVAAAGGDVAFCGLTDDGADEVRAVVDAAGGRALFRALDLRDREAARQFTAAAIDFLGGLDGLVNNAGANFWTGVNGATYEGIQTCFAVNFYSAWAVSQAAYGALKAAGGGVVVNLASIHAQRTLPGVFPYNVSKAMMVAMTQSMALEWGPDNIRAVAIAPGLIRTGLLDEYLAQHEDPAAELARMEGHYPGGRSGDPEDVASLIVFLLSGVSRFISGNTILVDGGISGLMESPDL